MTKWEQFEEILDGVALMIQNRCYVTPAGASALISSILRELTSALACVLEACVGEADGEE